MWKRKKDGEKKQEENRQWTVMERKIGDEAYGGTRKKKWQIKQRLTETENGQRKNLTFPTPVNGLAVIYALLSLFLCIVGFSAFLLQTPPKPSWTPTPLCFPLLPSGYVVLQTPQAFHEMKCLAFFIFHVFSLTLVELDWPITGMVRSFERKRNKGFFKAAIINIYQGCQTTNLLDHD